MTNVKKCINCKTRRQIFKILFVVYSSYSYSDEHNLSDYDFLPDCFNVPVEELFDYLLKNYPTFYSKFELTNLLRDLENSFDGFNGKINPVKFFEYVAVFRLDYNFAFCDLYLLAGYLNSIWDSKVAEVISVYEGGVEDAMKDPDIMEYANFWSTTYKDVDSFMNRFKYRRMFNL